MAATARILWNSATAARHAELRSQRAVGWVVLLMFWLAPQAAADHRDSFESAEPTWRLADADCGARITIHRRDFQTFHTGQASEQVSLLAQQGTYAYLAQDVPQARVIAEWTASLWVKADRVGLQLLARVVLPRSRDPQTGGPMTTLLRGDVYDRNGLWQRLAIGGAAQSLERQVRILRSQFGPEVDAREAYVDLLVINAYGARRHQSLDRRSGDGGAGANRPIRFHGAQLVRASSHRAAGRRSLVGGPRPRRCRPVEWHRAAGRRPSLLSTSHRIQRRAVRVAQVARFQHRAACRRSDGHPTARGGAGRAVVDRPAAQRRFYHAQPRPRDRLGLGQPPGRQAVGVDASAGRGVAAR